MGKDAPLAAVPEADLAEAGMSSDPIAAAMWRAAWSYGKLGLLIDDQPDAASWVARELYAADALPAWWLIARSMKCAAVAVETLAAMAGRQLRSLCIVDRYLPTECGKGYIPIAWDHDRRSPWVEHEPEIKAALRRSFHQLNVDPAGTAQGGRLQVVWVTSYPYEPGAPREAPIPWRTRAMEQLHRLRQDLAGKRTMRGLLRYGPEEDSPITGGGPPCAMDAEALAEARWRAETWRPILRSLSAVLQAEQPAVLLTGAGASLGTGLHGAGMPDTMSLLREAARHLASDASGVARRQLEEAERRERPCVCGDAATAAVAGGAVPGTGAIPLSRPPDVDPIVWLMNNVDSGAELDWSLDELLNSDLHEHSMDLFLRFHRALRDVLYEHDHGYPYHHWLLARMRWTTILTTNFDAFHERAAAAAARLPWLEEDERERILRLGSVASGHASSEGGLFKPYGSLHIPRGTLAFSVDQIRARKEAISSALHEAVGQARHGALVVIGHAMTDPFINQIISSQSPDLERLQLLWINPESYRRCRAVSLKTWKGHRPWDQALADRLEGCHEFIVDARRNGMRPPLDVTTAARLSGPLPAMAHEFVHDLWRMCQGS